MQVLWPNGMTRCCPWTWRFAGDASETTISEMRQGEARRMWEEWIANEGKGYCQFEDGLCPYYANGNLDNVMIEIDSVDDIPEYPEQLWLGFESSCNYNCTCCCFHNGGKECLPKEDAETLDAIVEKLQEALPHVTTISGNGTAELFCSPRILKLLADWKPLAPPEKCSAMLETNGSLFTPKNWEKIKNLGNYKLSVCITIMSFQENTYQYLSGTQLPISVIEENLGFVRSLREQGVINYLELCTVVQERNFREMPEMARRCLDEFGADCFRFRPLFLGGIYDENIQWFMDVRNPKHPYFEEYQQMLKDPIFKDPRVFMWSGDFLSSRGEHPGIAAKKKLWAIDCLINESDLLTDELKDKKIAIYNMGIVGKMVASQYKDKTNIVRCYSTRADMHEYQGIPVMQFSKEQAGKDAPDTVVITAYNNREKAVEKIRDKLGPDVRIIDLWDKLEKCDCCGC